MHRSSAHLCTLSAGNLKRAVDAGIRLRVSAPQNDACSLLTLCRELKVAGATEVNDSKPVLPLDPARLQQVT